MSDFNPLTDFPIAIDSTMRSAFVACEQRFFRSYIQGLSSLGGNVHLIAGGAFAKGCEVVRKSHYGQGLSIEESVLCGVIAAWEHYSDFDPPDKSYKTPERIAGALVEYFRERHPRQDHIQPLMNSQQQPYVEFSFAIPMEVDHPTSGDPLLYAGRFDMVGVFRDNIWVVDEKTASRLGPTWVNSFGLRGQLIGYCYGAQQFGLSVNGFIVRGLSFLKDYYGHAESMEVVPEYLLERWWKQVNIDAKRMIEAWQKGEYSFNFGDSCIGPYSPCPFKVLCDKEDGDQWAQNYFEISRWNPLDMSVKKASSFQDKVPTFSS